MSLKVKCTKCGTHLIVGQPGTYTCPQCNSSLPVNQRHGVPGARAKSGSAIPVAAILTVLGVISTVPLAIGGVYLLVRVLEHTSGRDEEVAEVELFDINQPIEVEEDDGQPKTLMNGDDPPDRSIRVYRDRKLTKVVGFMMPNVSGTEVGNVMVLSRSNDVFAAAGFDGEVDGQYIYDPEGLWVKVKDPE